MSAIGGLRSQALASHIALLSSPALEGRGLASPGLEAAAEYVAAQLALAGIGPVDARQAPPNPATAYFHPVAVRQISRASCQVRVESRNGETTRIRTFLGGVDASCPELPPGMLSAPLVYAGYGIRESSPARDDYQGLDVKGKVVVIHAGLPSGPEWQRPELRERYAAESGRRRFAAKAQLAASGGAVAVVAIEEPAYASAIASGADAPAAVFYTPFERDEEAGLPVVRLSAAAGDAILAAAGPADQALSSAAPRALPGKTGTLTFGGRRTPGAQPERHRHDPRVGSGTARPGDRHRRAHGSPRAAGRQAVPGRRRQRVGRRGAAGNREGVRGKRPGPEAHRHFRVLDRRGRGPSRVRALRAAPRVAVGAHHGLPQPRHDRAPVDGRRAQDAGVGHEAREG